MIIMFPKKRNFVSAHEDALDRAEHTVEVSHECSRSVLLKFITGLNRLFCLFSFLRERESVFSAAHNFLSNVALSSVSFRLFKKRSRTWFARSFLIISQNQS